ncbi:hypothetical protein Hanom_Chr09g00803771 [Helianthus anomalus]
MSVLVCIHFYFFLFDNRYSAATLVNLTETERTTLVSILVFIFIVFSFDKLTLYRYATVPNNASTGTCIHFYDFRFRKVLISTTLYATINEYQYQYRDNLNRSIRFEQYWCRCQYLFLSFLIDVKHLFISIPSAYIGPLL